MAKKYNRVPQGRAGTGEAFILPESKALGGLLESIDYNRKMGLLNVKAQNDYRKGLNKSYLDNQMKAENGLLFNSELQGYVAEHIKKGSQYLAKGFDIYNPDPSRPDQVAAHNEYMSERAQIQSMADMRAAQEKHYLSQLKEAQTGDYDEDSISAFHDFYKDTGSRLREIQESGATLPGLVKRFDTQEFMKGIKGASIKSNKIENGIETTTIAPNTDAIRYSIESSLIKDPSGMRWLNKQIGDSPVPVLGSTDPAEVSKYLTEYYASPDGAKEALKAFPPGKIPSVNSPEFQRFIAEQSEKQLKAENKREMILEDMTRQKMAEVDQQNMVAYNFDAENQAFKREDQGMQRTRFGWDKENQNEKREERKFKNEETNQRDKWLQGIQMGSREYVDRLRGVVKGKGGKVYYLRDGNTIRVEWNEKVGGDIVKRAKEIDLDERNENNYAALNEVLSSVSGKEIPIETLLAKPSYEGPLMNIGKAALKPNQIERFRSEFKSAQELGEFLTSNPGMMKLFGSKKEAFEAAVNIMDKKGKKNVVQQKKK